MFADYIGRVILFPAESEYEVRDIALPAGIAAGICRNLDDAIQQVFRTIGRTVDQSVSGQTS